MDRRYKGLIIAGVFLLGVVILQDTAERRYHICHSSGNRAHGKDSGCPERTGN